MWLQCFFSFSFNCTFCSFAAKLFFTRSCTQHSNSNITWEFPGACVGFSAALLKSRTGEASSNIYKINGENVWIRSAFVHNTICRQHILSLKNVKILFQFQSISHFCEIALPLSTKALQIVHVYKMAENQVTDDATVHVPLCIKY